MCALLFLVLWSRLKQKRCIVYKSQLFGIFAEYHDKKNYAKKIFRKIKKSYKKNQKKTFRSARIGSVKPNKHTDSIKLVLKYTIDKKFKKNESRDGYKKIDEKIKSLSS